MHLFSNINKMKSQFRTLACLVLLVFTGLVSSAQHSLSITILDSISGEPLAGATALLLKAKTGAAADAFGVLKLENIKSGDEQIRITYIGYTEKILSLNFPNAEKNITVLLAPSSNELEEVTISVSRTNSRIEDSPLKVEVLGKDDMNEENTIKPGNVASILGDISGIQIQQSSATSGNSNVRIQGLDGKYTQILRDGLPLYDGFSGGFGIMQLPPLDLKQIEIIKGSASTLYGGGAISGIINFVSRTPEKEPLSMITINQSTLMETNLNGFYSAKKDKIGLTIFSGVTRQSAVDVDKDGFSDVPELYNLVIHPRIFFYFNPKSTLAVGLSSIIENRQGGDMQVLKHKTDSLHTFFEENLTKRYTADAIFTFTSDQMNVLSIKGSASFFDLATAGNAYWFGGQQLNAFGELSYLIPRKKNELVFGINYQADMFYLNPADAVLFDSYQRQSLGGFIQETYKWKEKFFLEGGCRLDYHNVYGIHVLPSLAGLYKFDSHWYMRLGAGMGYKNPDLFSSSTVETDPSALLPLSNNLKSENSLGGNLEINYTGILFNKVTLLINHAFFYTYVQSPLLANTDTSGFVSYSNADGKIQTRGTDTYIRASFGRWEVYLGYTYTWADQHINAEKKPIYYTPRHRAAATVVYEIEEKWRFGLEGSYNGPQIREDGSKTKDYVFLAAMIEKKFKHLSLVLNGENLFDFRQTRFESIVLPPYSNPTFKTLWAPIDGRVINLSLLIKL